MIKLRGALVPEEEFYCTTMKEAARLLNIIGLLARVYGRPEPVRFLGFVERNLARGDFVPPGRSPGSQEPCG
jgi:hypothetical protein